MRLSSTPLVLTLVWAALAASALHSATPAKKVVEKADDLPRHTYTLPKPPSEVLRDDAAFTTLAAAVKKDILSDLATHDVQDRTALQRYKSTLLNLAVLERDFASIRTLIAELRALEERFVDPRPHQRTDRPRGRQRRQHLRRRRRPAHFVSQSARQLPPA
ncbi:MAG: hypothetical protein NTZ29_18090 [Verrucomicrobia bacterium]|nr:hypothetical protein [Verrucomicrobiota bacterium]